MSKIYDNWEKLVEAVLDREELRQLALCSSFSSSSSADTSCDSTIFDFSALEINCNPSYITGRHIPLKDIKKATRNFGTDLCIGRGPFGVIYKGRILRRSLGDVKGFMGAISFSRTTVAMKKVERMTLDMKECLLTEIKYLNQLDHPNVVKFKGYCIEGDNMVLVYEFLSKGSLGYYLFQEKQRPLPWNRRIKVAVDIARALSYLHDSKIIHGDLHLDHILLDEGFNAKISGFGSAMDGPGNDLPLLPGVIRGTCGIGAPEYITRGHLSTRCDVFSFGVILLQIISGRRILEEDDLVELAKAYIGDKLWLAKLIDPKLEDEFPFDQANLVLSLANHCLNSNPELRPQMCKVLLTLEPLLRF